MAEAEVDVEEERLEFKWGKKRGIGGKKKDVQFYDSFTFDGLDYKLFDAVYLHKEGEAEPYIGKLIKIWENRDKSKKVKVHWFFRPREIRNFLEGNETCDNELFLACGEGPGLANVNPLEAVAGKCNVICISKDIRNPQPSDEELNMAEFVFYRFFDVGRRKILDKIDDKIAGIEEDLNEQRDREMDVKKYWFSSSSPTIQSIRLGRSYTKPHYQNNYDGPKPVWQMLWRKLKRDKKKVFSSTPTVEVIYDPESYSMNFDQGTGWMEPDNLPRSFSARYADPPRILPPDIY